MKIVTITSDSYRHKYLPSLIEISKNLDLKKSFIEKNKKTKTSQYNSIYLKKYLNDRKKIEKKIFKKFVSKNFNKKKQKIIKEHEINSNSFVKKIDIIKPDLIISFGCSIIKSRLINKYKYKFINIHLGLSPYMRGAGTNFFPFYLKKLELLGSTIMFIDYKLDDGKIIHQITPNFVYTDNIHTVGLKLIKKTFLELIEILQSKKKLVGKKFKVKNSYYFKRKDFNETVLIKAKENLKKGIIRKYINKKRKVKIIKFL